MSLKKGTLKRVSLGVLLALGMAILLYFIFIPSPVQVEVAQVVIGPFKETIRADGVLRSKERYTVPAFADGDIKRVSLKVGDVVKKDDKITELFWDIKYEPVKSPIAGVISKVYRESAGPIRRGEPIVEIVDTANLEVVAELLTTDAIRLRVSNDVEIENWSGEKPLEAKIVRISKAGFIKQSALGVEEERTEVVAELVNPPRAMLEAVGSTFHVDLIFTVKEADQALKIPVGALFRDGTSWAVYIADEGRAHKVKVEISGIGSQEVWVLSGLREGQRVLVYPGDLVKEGSRIRIEP